MAVLENEKVPTKSSNKTTLTNGIGNKKNILRFFVNTKILTHPRRPPQLKCLKC